jgi:hypothetical protein
MYRRSRFAITSALLGTCLAVSGCKKNGGGTNAPSDENSGAAHVERGEKPTEPDQMVEAIVAAMQSGDRDWILSFAEDPLHEELSQEAFNDFSAVIKWLGALQDFHVESNNDQPVALQRDYLLSFEKGEVNLHVTAYPDGGGLIGFRFSGDAFVRAEHGALDDHYAKFKVYDFSFLTEGKERIKGDSVPAGRINYQVVVGGLVAEEGEHHITMEKIVFNDGGKEVYHEPIEMDLRFEENAEGIPRGILRGFVYIDEAGHYDIDLKIKDNVSKEEIDYHHDVQVVTAGSFSTEEDG